MMKSRKLSMIAIVLVVNLMIPRSTFAWSDGGHRVIGRIAWSLLTPAERTKIARLIRGNPTFSRHFSRPSNVRVADADEWLFTQAAVWSDIVRSDRQFHRDTWHYINRPFFPSDADRRALEGRLSTNLDMEVPARAENARLNAVQATKFSLQKLKANNVSAREKGIYICWLFHLVGDLHQPLHTTALFSRNAFRRGDRGGNLIVTNSGNLHFFWDGQLGRRLSLNDVRSRATRIVRDPALADVGAQAAMELKPESWVKEGWQLCKDVVYNDAILTAVKRLDSHEVDRLETVTLDSRYQATAGKTSQRRVLAGGYRLAQLLKQVASAQPDNASTPRLRISALLPDPAGQDQNAEVIRLKNLTRSSLSLSGWRVRDDNGDTLRLGGTINAGQEKEVVDTTNAIPLSNSGETVELINPQGRVEHRVRYRADDVKRDRFISFDR